MWRSRPSGTSINKSSAQRPPARSPELTPADPDADYIAVNYYSLVPPQIVSMSVVGEWLNAATPGAARQVLDAHPELLTREGEMAHYLIADQQKEPLARDHILRKRLLLLRRARTVGADIAFDELARGTLPVSHARPIPEDPAVLQTLPQTLYALLGTSSVRETEGVLERHPELLHPVVDGMLPISPRTANRTRFVPGSARSRH